MNYLLTDIFIGKVNNAMMLTYCYDKVSRCQLGCLSNSKLHCPSFGSWYEIPSLGDISLSWWSSHIVSVLGSGSNGLSSSPGCWHCVVFLGKTLHSPCPSPPSCDRLASHPEGDKSKMCCETLHNWQIIYLIKFEWVRLKFTTIGFDWPRRENTTSKYNGIC